MAEHLQRTGTQVSSPAITSPSRLGLAPQTPWWSSDLWLASSDLICARSAFVPGGDARPARRGLLGCGRTGCSDERGLTVGGWSDG